ncbi:MAG: UDP-N-acetylmuramate dehydrogenase [Rhodospirillales bacterium]|nr:UDP-N-acetylmuramate dehydrogenase [Rhodospirillales bacterium]
MTNLSLKSSGFPAVRGRITENAALGDVGWFRCGGRADVLFKPADEDDLAVFLAGCPADIPVTVIGVMSNAIIRDGGVRGVVIRLGREFAGIEKLPDGTIRAGAAALDGNVAAFAAREGVANIEFLSGIPGTIGGALRMNAGAYGAEIKDVLIAAVAIDRTGNVHHMSPDDMGMTYRHTSVPEDYIFTGCTLRGTPGVADDIKAQIAEIKARRNDTQPIRERTGGSTFANPKPEELAAAGLPEGTKAWQLVDRVGGRGLKIGGAQMSEKHANFMINTGDACAADLENLGEEIRRRVKEETGFELRWEIKRIGDF